MWLYNQDEFTKETFTNPETTIEDIIQTVEENKILKNYQMGNGYDLSKAGLNALSMIQGKYSIQNLCGSEISKCKIQIFSQNVSKLENSQPLSRIH